MAGSIFYTQMGQKHTSKLELVDTINTKIPQSMEKSSQYSREKYMKQKLQKQNNYYTSGAKSDRVNRYNIQSVEGNYKKPSYITVGFGSQQHSW